MFRYVCVVFAILASFLVSGISDEERGELRDYMSDVTDVCLKEFDISLDDYEKAKKNREIAKLDPCLMSCIMKGRGVIDDKGMFDMKAANEIIDKFVKSPDEVEKVKKVNEICNSVNDKPVHDGDKGCERAILLLKCVFDNKSQVV